jgi:hypothetical protein
MKQEFEYRWADPSHATMTVTVSAQRGLRIAVVLLWESIMALIRRTDVSFEAWND